MISEGGMCMHLHDMDLVVQHVVLQLMLVACFKHLYVAWLLLIHHLCCKVWFGLCLQVAALVARLRLAWAG